MKKRISRISKLLNLKKNYIYFIQHKNEDRNQAVLSKVIDIEAGIGGKADYIIFEDIETYGKNYIEDTNGWGLFEDILKKHFIIEEKSPKDYPEYYI
jgi:hypothetical protein